MEINEEKSSYYQLFEDLSSFLNKNSSHTEINKMKGTDLLNGSDVISFLKYSPGITAIIDFPNEGYVYMSDNVEEMWGYKAEEFIRLGLVKAITIFPREQNEIIIKKIFPIMFEHFFRHAEAGNVNDVRVSYTTKVIRGDGSIGWYLHQMKVLHLDEATGKPQFGFKLITDIGDFKKDEAMDMNVSIKDANGMYQKVYSQSFIANRKEFGISDREIEVLALISNGKSSKEIADLLFISEHTVYNHRKNMLKKLDVKSTGEILKKAIAHGII